MWEAHTCSDHWDKVRPATATANNAHWIWLPVIWIVGLTWVLYTVSGRLWVFDTLTSNQRIHLLNDKYKETEIEEVLCWNTNQMIFDSFILKYEIFWCVLIVFKPAFSSSSRSLPLSTFFQTLSPEFKHFILPAFKKTFPSRFFFVRFLFFEISDHRFALL